MVALADRVVEVVGDLGPNASPRYRYGSGCIVSGRTVLTAAHAVAGADAVFVRGRDKRRLAARVDPAYASDLDAVDLALVELEEDTGFPAIPAAAVDRGGAAPEVVDRCHTVGYPAFKERAVRGVTVRDTVGVGGHIPVLANLVSELLTLYVTASPRPLPQSGLALAETEWSGMSGAPVWAGEYLIGVVTEHAPREGSSALTVTPLTHLSRLENAELWWQRLGVDLVPIPAAAVDRPRPVYTATLREIHARTPLLLDRESELADIAAFAVGDRPYLWLVGGAWAGKTSLAAEVVLGAMPPEVRVVAYFLSRREADADSNHFLAAVVPQLAYLLDEDPPDPDLHVFRALWERAVAWAAQHDRHLLLVVDALDEDLRPTGAPSVAAVLPTLAGGAAHVLVTSRPHPELPSDLPVDHPLRTTTPTDLSQSAEARAVEQRARQEIEALLREDLAIEVLGLLAAASGPLSVDDLAQLTNQRARTIRRFVTERAARSLQPVGGVERRRYQFAHAALLDYCATGADTGEPEFLARIHQWAQEWQDKRWPITTPRYLLDSYPSVLAAPDRERLVTDIGWQDTTVQLIGVDAVLPYVRKAGIVAQAHNLRLPLPVQRPGYVIGQLLLQAQLDDDPMAEQAGLERLSKLDRRVPFPMWAQRTNPALAFELGLHPGGVSAMTVLPDGRVVTAGYPHGRLLLWDPALPGSRPWEIGEHGTHVTAMASTPENHLVTATDSGRIFLWNTRSGGAPDVEFRAHAGSVDHLVVLPDGRLVTATVTAGPLLLWDLSAPDQKPVRLRVYNDSVDAMICLPDGRVLTASGLDGRLDVWEPRPDQRPVRIGTHGQKVAGMVVMREDILATVSEYGGLVLLWERAEPGATAVTWGTHGDGWVFATAAMTPNQFVTASGVLGELLVWRLPPSEPIRLGVHGDGVEQIAAASHDRMISAGHRSGRLLGWDADLVLSSDHDHDAPISALCALPDGRVVSASWWDRSDLVVWDRRPATLGSLRAPVDALAVLPDGRVVTESVDTPDRLAELLIWYPTRPGESSERMGFVGSHAVPLAVLPSGHIVTAGGRLGLAVWDPDLPGSDPVVVVEHHGAVSHVLPVSDRHVITGSGDEGRLLLWDLATGEPFEMGQLGQKLGSLTSLTENTLLTLGVGPGDVYLWDLSRPFPHPTHLGRHGRGLKAVALADGRFVTAGDSDHVRIWDHDRSTVLCATGPVRALAAAPAADGHHVFFAGELGGLSAWWVPPR